MSSSDNRGPHPRDLASLVLTVFCVFVALIFLATYAVTNPRGFVSLSNSFEAGIALLVRWGPWLLLVGGALYVANKWGLPVLTGILTVLKGIIDVFAHLSTIFSTWSHNLAQPRRNGAWALNEHMGVVDAEKFPLTRLEAVKDLHIQQKIEGPAPVAGLLSAPETSQILTFKDVFPQLHALAQANLSTDNVKEKQWLLGRDYETQQLKEINFYKQLRSLLIGGKSQYGKSVTASWLAINAVCSGFQLLHIDPHGKFEEDSLNSRIGPFYDRGFYAQAPLNASTREEIIAAFRWLEAMYEHRINTGTKTPFIFVLIDEYASMLSKFNPKRDRDDFLLITETLADILTGGWKAGCCLLIISHNWQLEGTGGARIRQNAIGKLAHKAEIGQYKLCLDYSIEDDLKHWAGLTTQSPYPEMGQGEVIVNLDRDGLGRYRIPFVTRDDVRVVADMMTDLKRNGWRTTTSGLSVPADGAERSRSLAGNSGNEGGNTWKKNRTGSTGAARPSTPMGDSLQLGDQQAAPPDTDDLPCLPFTDQEVEPASHSRTPTEQLAQHTRLPSNYQHIPTTQPLRPLTSTDLRTPSYSTPPETPQPSVPPIPTFPPQEQKRENSAEDLPTVPPGTSGTRSRSDQIPLTARDREHLLAAGNELQAKLGYVPITELKEACHISGHKKDAFKVFYEEQGWSNVKPVVIARETIAEQLTRMFAFYNYTCLRCGRRDVPLEPDHIIPRSLGGVDDLYNRQVLCKYCNNEKNEHIIEDYRKDRPDWLEIPSHWYKLYNKLKTV